MCSHKGTSENLDGFTFRNTEPVPFMACTMVYGPFLILQGHMNLLPLAPEK